MSDESTHDQGLHILNRQTKKHNHTGPRKRRPRRKKASTVTPNGANWIIPASETPMSSVKKDLNATAAPFTPPRTPLSTPISHPPTRTPDPPPSPSPIHPSPASNVLSHSFTLPLSLHHQSCSSDDSNDEELELEIAARDRAYWTQWVIAAAEKERARRLNILKQLQREEEEEVLSRRRWAIAAIEQEQRAMQTELFLDSMTNTQWFQSTIKSSFNADYQVVCPYSWLGCAYSCMLRDLEAHLLHCPYRETPEPAHAFDEDVDFDSYDVVCPNAILGCSAICARENLAHHLGECPVGGMTREKEYEERQAWRQNVILATEAERVRRMDEDAAIAEEEKDESDGTTSSGPKEDLDSRKSPEATRRGRGRLSWTHLQRLYEEQTAVVQTVLHEEVRSFVLQQQKEGSRCQKWREESIASVKHEVERMWGSQAHVEVYGSYVTGLHCGSSDVDIVVFGVADGLHLSPQDCVTSLADHFASSDTIQVSEVSAITRAAIPLLKVIVLQNTDGSTLSVPFDITFDDPHGTSHNGVASATLVQRLSGHLRGLQEITFVLKQLLVKRGVNDPYCGGLSSYGLFLMIAYVLLLQPPISDTVVQEDVVDEYGNDRLRAQKEKGNRIADIIIQQHIERHAYRESSTKETVKHVFQPHHQRSQQQESRVLGKLLMDVLHFYSNEFRHDQDIVSLLDLTALDVAADEKELIRSPPIGPSSPPDAQNHVSTGGLMIHDPLFTSNNVGKTCYRVSQVLKDFSDFLSVLTALIVRGSVRRTATQASNGEEERPTSCGILASVFDMNSRESRT